MAAYDKAVEEEVKSGLEVRPEMGKKSIFITQLPIEGHFYGAGYPDVALLSFADWKKYFAPPSALEFILRGVQQYAIFFLAAAFSGNHLATRGCIFDYNKYLEDMRNKILISYICEDCESELKRLVGDEKFNQIDRLVRLSWIGKVDEPGSIANILKSSFGYDLDLTKGFKPSWQERAKETLQSAFIQETIKFASAILLAAALLYLGLKEIK